MTAILQFFGGKLQTKPRRIGKTGKKIQYPQNPPRDEYLSSPVFRPNYLVNWSEENHRWRGKKF
jgi:hypothetical protein